MKRQFALCAAVLMAASLAGCRGLTKKTTISAPAVTQSPAAEATPAPTQLPELLTGTDAPVLPYDEIRPISQGGVSPHLMAEGYYTMSQDGLWGLLRSDGTEVLPCQSLEPVTRCFLGHWHSYTTDANADETAHMALLDTLNAQLAQSGDGVLGGDHGDEDFYFTHDAETGRVFDRTGETPADDQDAAVYGPWLPCREITFSGEGGLWGYAETGEGVRYYDKDGAPLADGALFEDAGYFYDQALAPVKLDGLWAYIDRSGTLLTDAVYSDTYGTIDHPGEAVWPLPCAAYLQNGYAAVCRDGLWGLLDSTGTEVVPCEYAGAVWDGSTLWLRQEDGWRQYTVEGAAPAESSATALAALYCRLSGDITRPDALPPKEEPSVYITTSDVGLVLRTGPGPDYTKLDLIPMDTEVTRLALSSQADNWMLTSYNGQYGWVCTDYVALPDA